LSHKGTKTPRHEDQKPKDLVPSCLSAFETYSFGRRQLANGDGGVHELCDEQQDAGTGQGDPQGMPVHPENLAVRRDYYHCS